MSLTRRVPSSYVRSFPGSRPRGILAIALAATSCFSPESGIVPDGSDSTTGSSSTSETPDGSTTETTSTSGESSSTTTTSTEDAGTSSESESTGVPVEPLCGDGIPVAGELCFDDPPQTFAVGPSPIDVAVGDLTGNGVPDLVTLNQSSPQTGSHTFLEADGLGGFVVSDGPRAPGNPSKIALVDADADGDVDIFSSGSDGFFYSQNAHPYFEQSVTTWFANSLEYQDQRVLDFTGDGIVDLGSTQGYSQEIYPGSITNERWATDTSLGIRLEVPGEGVTGFVPAALAVDGNDTLDIVALNAYYNTAQVLVGNGIGTFTPYGEVQVCADEFAGGRHGEAGDFNGDGDLDLVITCVNGDISILLATGIAFGQFTVLPLADAHRPVVVDLDQDGDLDILVSSPTLRVVVLFENDGAGTFTLHDPPFRAQGSVYGFAVHDLDDDGALDVIVPSGLGEQGQAGQLDIYYAAP